MKYLQELHLEMLDQQTTNLEYLFNSLTNLRYFNSLSFKRSRIEEMPTEILKLKNLKKVEFSMVECKKEPLVVYQIDLLETLYFRATNLEQISEEVARLKNLKKLCVIANGYKYNAETLKFINGFTTTKEKLKAWLPHTAVLYRQTGNVETDFLMQEGEKFDD
jgi:Leucine-rich repeat (LRR) protein